MTRTQRQRFNIFLREWVRPIAVVVFVVLTFKSSVADWYDVPTGSMRPTVVEGDRILVSKVAYDLKVPFTRARIWTWGDPQPGDVVICHAPDDGTRLVKRVIAGPGDTVAMTANRLTINGEPVTYTLEGSASATVVGREWLGEQGHPIQFIPGKPAPRHFAPTRVPDDQYLVMGDNRDDSKDSRSFGFMPRREIVGKVHRVAFSLDRKRWYLPRCDRFFKSMD